MDDRVTLCVTVRGGPRAFVPNAATRRSIVIEVDHPTFPLTMSLTSTGNIKTQLRTALGDKSPLYFSAFQLYLKALISRQEFEDQMRDCLDTPHLRASSDHSSERDSRAHFHVFTQCSCTTHL